MLETIEIPNQNIQGLIKMAIKEQLSWLTLASVLDELATTFAISKQVIKILVTELETLQTTLKKAQVDGVSISEQETSITQNEERKILFPEEDKIDCTNDVLEIDETFENKPKDSEIVGEENYNKTIKTLVERGEKLYTFIGDNHDTIDENKAIHEKVVTESEKENNQFEKTKHSTTEIGQKTKHICNACGEEFISETEMTMHERIHTGIKPFQCKTCKKLFSVKRTLKSHEVQMHSNEKPYQCPYCPKGFASKSKFMQHDMIHTGEVPFQCKTCNKRFNKKSNLTLHEKIHANKKEFHCKSCDKSFNYKQSLIKHERVHTGEKPYKCETCSKTFRDSTHLTVHIRVHTGERPYQCQNCEKCFTTSTHLKSHEKAHHKKI